MCSLEKKIRNQARISIIFCFLSSSLSASLMMTPEEVSILNSITSDPDVFDGHDEIAKINSLPDILFLSAILYFNPNHWSVWINDKTYTASDPEDDKFKLMAVTQHIVEIELKGHLKKRTRMRANQSLLISDRRVIDGDARVKPNAFQL